MEEKMKNKLSSILERVKEPQSGLSISEMGYVAGIKHEPITNKLIVVTDTRITPKACCMVFNLFGISRIENLLTDELKKEFPELEVKFVNKN